MSVTFDATGVLENGEDTYRAIAEYVSVGDPVVLAWTDGEGTQFDLLMALYPKQFGALQGGLNQGASLFVAVIRHGCFGFRLGHDDTHPSYFAEKLGLAQWNESSTIAKLAELINGVRVAIREVTI